MQQSYNRQLAAQQLGVQATGQYAGLSQIPLQQAGLFGNLSTLQQQMGQGQGPGQPGRQGQARANQETDPLGRPLRGRDYDDSTVKVPLEADVQRARRILDELRRRFGETARPQLELDYIERLLKDY